MELRYSKDGKCSFNPGTNIYMKGGWKRLQGVTSFINNYKNKVDFDKIAEKYAKKRGLIKEDVLMQWKYEGVISRESGTAVHTVIETFVKTGKIEVTGVYRKELVAIKFIKDLLHTERLIPVEVEMIVYGDNLASQIDLVVKNKKGHHFIIDHKTNKEIKTNGWKRFLLPPFNKYPDANFYHYSLQTCIYKKLCRDYDIKGMYIVHFGECDYSIIKAEEIPVPEHLL